MKVSVVAPVADGVTANPDWMVTFAKHLEACGFESIVAVEHTLLSIRYDSVYPYDGSGRVGLAADCPIPDPPDLLAFLAGDTRRLGLGMPPTTEIQQAEDMLSACAQRLSSLSS